MKFPPQGGVKPVAVGQRSPVADTPMRISVITDARSPIARGWIEAVAVQGHRVQVLSTYPVLDVEGADDLVIVPTLTVRAAAVRARVRHSRDETVGPSARAALGASPRTARLYRDARLLGELLFRSAVQRAIAPALARFQPDIFHAMRIPYEAILSGAAARHAGVPFAVSTWGNDLTLHAAESRLYARATRTVLAATAALHCDCERDARLATRYGYCGPVAVIPGSGGVDTRVFHDDPGDRLSVRARLGVSADSLLVFNPRSAREYVRHDTFLRAIPVVLQRAPTASFVCVDIDRQAGLRRLAGELGVEASLRFLPKQTPAEMAALFRAADIMVSPSLHDGTPNTLLEAMACGSFPVVGRIDSVCEWISDGVNGILVDPTHPDSLARGMLRAFDSPELRLQCRRINRDAIAARASREAVALAITAFYRRALGHRGWVTACASDPAPGQG